MKCRNCGATANGLKCPVCGHKLLKKAECSVCFTAIFSGQEYCPKCGSPTVYRKLDNVKKITPDTIIHSDNSHNYDTVSESYNYQEDAYDYNENNSKKPSVMTFSSIFEPLKNSKKKTYHYQKSAKQKKTLSVSLIVISVFLVFFLSTAVIFIQNPILRDTVGSFFESDIDEGNTAFEDFILTHDTTQSDYNHNVIDNGLSFVYNNQLYIADYDGIYVYRSDQEPYLLIDDMDCSFLYVDESGVYYKNFDNQYILNQDGSTVDLLFDVERCYQMDDEIIYLNQDEQLLIYHLDTSTTTLLYDNIYNFTVDDVNRRILVFNNNENEVLIDFEGNILKDNFNKVISSYGSYFINGNIYFKDYDGIHCCDIMSDQMIDIYPDLECYKYAVLDNDEAHGLYTIDHSDYLSYTYLEDDEYVYYDICDNVDSLYIYDDKIVFYTYDDDYNRVFYIGDNQGRYARLQ